MHSAWETIRQQLQGKKIAILGLGMEGRSTLSHLQTILPGQTFRVCDINPDILGQHGRESAMPGVEYHIGPDYLKGLSEADIVFKSPGIPVSVLEPLSLKAQITSQTDLFIRLYRSQVVGITGTKGKSTTASFLYHLLSSAGKKALLVGNIGMPCFDVMDQIEGDTIIVFEMSSHQLQDMGVSPHVSILLNIFEEHLDYYPSYEAYQQAKINIARWQVPGDVLICHSASPILRKLLSRLDIPSRVLGFGPPDPGYAAAIVRDGDDFLFDDGRQRIRLEGAAGLVPLPGEHNLENAAAAIAAAIVMETSANEIIQAIPAFKPLPHRLEYVGRFGGVDYYNDSISTIPEATMAAIKALPSVQTLILGGKDRGVDFHGLMHYLSGSEVDNFCFTGDAGRRMRIIAEALKGFRGKRLVGPLAFDDCVMEAIGLSKAPATCLLSPAAASYDAFGDFKERGERFKAIIAGHVMT